MNTGARICVAAQKPVTRNVAASHVYRAPEPPGCLCQCGSAMLWQRLTCHVATTTARSWVGCGCMLGGVMCMEECLHTPCFTVQQLSCRWVLVRVCCTQVHNMVGCQFVHVQSSYTQLPRSNTGRVCSLSQPAPQQWPLPIVLKPLPTPHGRVQLPVSLFRPRYAAVALYNGIDADADPHGEGAWRLLMHEHPLEG